MASSRVVSSAAWVEPLPRMRDTPELNDRRDHKEDQVIRSLPGLELGGDNHLVASKFKESGSHEVFKLIIQNVCEHEQLTRAGTN